ncbi:MAG TPA: hypothetical protein VJ044_00290, partial [Candidatus Hodarchaeales archaeon]|nr:hypothetical protein [Candidatus Hodarchaeales archaeon]
SKAKSAKQVQKKLHDFGIRGVLVITRDGMPVLVREYGDPIETTMGDRTLVSAFFSAMAHFADENISGLLSDIGMHTLRFFFDHTEDLLFLLAVDEVKITLFSTYELRTLLKATLAEIKIDIIEFFINKGDSIEDVTRDPQKFEKARNELSSIGPSLDKILHKSYLKALKLLEEEKSSALV